MYVRSLVCSSRAKTERSWNCAASSKSFPVASGPCLSTSKNPAADGRDKTFVRVEVVWQAPNEMIGFGRNELLIERRIELSILLD